MKNKIIKLFNSKIIKNSIWLSILQLVNTIIPMITIPYLTRILGADKYGVFSLALNWILYFQVLVEFGFGLNGARKVATVQQQKELQEIFNNIISARIILLIITFILLNIVAVLSGFNKETYFCMLLLYIMVLGTAFQLTWLFQGKQDMKFITIINCISRIISVILTFLMVKNSSDVYLYCIFYSITIFLSSIISLIIARKKYDLKFKFSLFTNIKKEINEGKYLFISSAIAKIFNGLGITVLGFVATSNIVGIYSAIYKIPYILTMFFSPLSQAIFPYISIKMKNSIKDGEAYIKKVCLPIFLIFLILSSFIIIFRGFIVEILFGHEYTGYCIIVIPLVLQFIFGMINNFLGVQFLVASNKQKEYSKALSIGCILIIVFNIVLGYYFSIFGVAQAALYGEISLTLLLLRQIKKIKKEEKMI